MAREYKDSGIEWIGQIPKEWKMTRGKFLFSVLNGYAFDSSLFTNDTNMMPLIRIRDINSSETEAYYMGEYPSDYIVHKDDVLVGMDGDFNVAKWKGNDALLNQRVCKLKEFSETYISQYAYYILPMLLKNKNDVTYATTVKHLSSNDILNFDFIVPSLSEQQKIADYLDKVCGEVDEMVALQETMVEELKAYKQSAITEAVTKGLNPNAPMRNSGIDWIGAIPEHWILSKAKFFVDITNGCDPKTEGNIPVYGSGASSFKTCGEYKEGPTVLIGRKGATLHIPHYIEGKYWNVDTAFDVKVKNGFDLRYYYYTAICFDYKYYISQTTLPGMAQSSYNNMIIPVPSIEEQCSIASYLDTKCSEIDSLIALKLAKIEELKEYKKSVIYEYVTGKKEVC